MVERKKNQRKDVLFSVLLLYLSSPQMTLTCRMGTTRAAPRILAITTASTIWFLCWFIPPETTTIKYLVLSSTISRLVFLYSLLNSKHGLYPNPSGCSQNSLFSPSSLTPRWELNDPAETIPCDWVIPQGFGEKGIKGSRLNHIFSMAMKPKRKKARNQSLGFLNKKEKNLLELLEDFLGETSRDWREEEERELIICEGTEM